MYKHYSHIDQIWNDVEACKNRDELEELLDSLDEKWGSWDIKETEDGCLVVNSYFDSATDSTETDARDLVFPEEEKFYYAKPIEDPYYDFENYYTDDMMTEDKIYIGGNRDYQEMNEELYEKPSRILEYLSSDLETELEDEDNDEDNINGIFLDLARSYLRGYDKGIALVDGDYNAIIQLAFDWDETGSEDDRREVVAQFLEILYAQEFIVDTIRGSSPSDWNYMIHPKSLSRETVEYIEALYFGTGTELEISCSKCTKKEFEDGDTDNYHDFTALYNDKDIIEWLANDVIGCKPEEVKLLEI